jgi:hypothetical protein
MKTNIRNFTGFQIQESPHESFLRIRILQNVTRARAETRAKAIKLVKMAALGFALGVAVPLLTTWLTFPTFRFSVDGVTRASGLTMSDCLNRWVPFEGTSTRVGCHIESTGERLSRALSSPVMPKRASRLATRNV